MSALNLAISAVGLWISIIVPMGAMFAFVYNKIERNDGKLEQNNERWLATETKILAIMNRLEMRYTDPNAPNKEATK